MKARRAVEDLRVNEEAEMGEKEEQEEQRRPTVKEVYEKAMKDFRDGLSQRAAGPEGEPIHADLAVPRASGTSSVPGAAGNADHAERGGGEGEARDQRGGGQGGGEEDGVEEGVREEGGQVEAPGQEGEEEGRRPKALGNPESVSKKMREEHELTHLPYR